MKRSSTWLLCLALPLASEASPLVYAGDPIPVLLPVGQERRIEVVGAREIRVGLSQALRERLHVESAGPHVWLTAREAFPFQRAYLETEEGLLVLRIRTDEQAPTRPVSIAANPGKPAAPPPPSADGPPGYVALMRYAVQALYAPDHREAPIAGIRQAPVEGRPVALFRCRATYPSACGDAVESIPHAAWQAPPYFVTAVTIRNLLPESLTLDPRDIRGRFAASAIVHPRLEATGSARDTTTAVLISHVPFEHAR